MITGRTQITAENQSFYDKNLLVRALPNFVHTLWAQVRDLPRNAGTNQIKFRRYSNMSVATTPLQAGITPVGNLLAVTDITADVLRYGDFVTVDDVVQTESIDNVLVEAGELLGDQYADTIDQLTRDILAAGTSATYSGTSNTQNSEVAAGDVITAANIKAAVLILKLNNCKKITRMVDASTGVGTVPVEACYLGIVHPTISAGFKNATNFPNWVPVEKYANKSGVVAGEIGKMDEVRFIETTNAKIFASAGTGSIDLYATIIFGQNAYGTTRISGEAVKNIIKPLGSAGTADPLDQRSTSGWKASFVAKILNNAFITRIVSAAV
jgi:N4-gp56 family major capsid protein